MSITKDFVTIDEMHRTARGFINTACLLREEPCSCDYYALYTPAYAVNLAFACELSLKEIILISGSTYKGIHYLDDLFAALPTDIQQAIQTYYSIEHRGEQIIDCLAAYRNAFVIWRYLHEQEESIPVPHDDLLSAANAIRSVAKVVYVKYAGDLGEEIYYAD